MTYFFPLPLKKIINWLYPNISGFGGQCVSRHHCRGGRSGGSFLPSDASTRARGKSVIKNINNRMNKLIKIIRAV